MTTTVNTAGSVPYPGQWRLARVDMANWGTFNGFQSLPVDRRGLLITGPSGSGKSTVLDAVAAVLTPPTQLSLNAAASNGGQRDKGRSISNYVRGACGHSADEEGEVVHTYLRPKAAVWSGVMLRYEDGFDIEQCSPSEARRHEAINVLGIFFQKANTVNPEGLKKFFAVVRGDHALSEFEPYGLNEADMAQFNKDHKETGRAWRDHAAFEGYLCNILHISSPKTLTLLHKTQAAKNIGSLDDLFRKYMLDTPRTHALATAAVAQFKELEEAHDGVVDQRRQTECLEPLLRHEEAYVEAKITEDQNRQLLDKLASFADDTSITLLKRRLERQLHDADALTTAVKEAESEQAFAKQKLEAAEAVLNEQGGIALEAALMQVSDRERQLLHIEGNRDSLEQDLEMAIESPLPSTREEFEALKRTLAACADTARAWLDGHEDEKIARFGEVSEQKKRHAEIAGELRFLRGQRSNISSRLHDIRLSIARHLGVSTEDLPFMGELIDVKPEEDSWQPAIERVLGGRARTMLVEKRHAASINEYLESIHLGERFEYDAVPDDVSVPDRPLHPQSLVRKVTVVQVPSHESLSRWANKLLRDRFDYVCVDSPADMERHDRALTRGGQTKAGEHHVKDDRRKITDRSRWVLGSTNDRKIERLEQELRLCSESLAVATNATAEITAKEQECQALCRTERSLRDKHWEDYDNAQAAFDLERAQAFYDELAQSDAFREAESRRATAQGRLDEANKAVQKALVNQQTNEERIQDTRSDIAEVERRINKRNPSGIAMDDETRAQFIDLFSSANDRFDSDTSLVYQTSNDVQRILDARVAKAARAQQDARRRTELVLQQYKSTWKLLAADLSASFEDRDAYIGRYRQIRASGLPQYERKFLDVLNSFSQDQITAISSEIRNAFREVRDRLVPVNRSLLLSEFSSGIHLQIEVKEHRSLRVNEFLADLKEITRGSWEEDDLEAAERRYARTAAIMKRLGSNDRSDQTWRMACLNTPDHMKFIAKEVAGDGAVVNVHSNDGGLSGGQKQKLVFFCLAAALRYQLSDEDQPVPSYGTIILDEAFDKSDRHFAEEALGIFEAFGFHMVLATPGKLLQTAEDHIGAMVMVTCSDDRHSRLSSVVFEADDRWMEVVDGR